MTIHKAKGLSFGTVFFYWKPSARGGRDGGVWSFSSLLTGIFPKWRDYLLDAQPLPEVL